MPDQPEHPEQGRQLWRQREAAMALGISATTLRRFKDAPRVYLQSPTGKKPLLRYDPKALRLWWSIKQGGDLNTWARKIG